MANVYLMNDGYFKEQYPSHNDLDMSKFYSTLLVEQNTTIENWIGTILFDYLMANASGILTGDVLRLFNNVKYSLVFLTAASLIKLGKTPDEAKTMSIGSLDEKAGYLKSKVITLIENSTELQTIITTDGTTTDNALPDTDTFESPIHFWR